MTATLTAQRSLPSLLTSLQRAGWGPLAGRDLAGVRAVLVGLTARLPHKSAQGMVTEYQIADAAGKSLRWTRRCLHVLEDLGVIEDWRRGGVVAGEPQPSWLRVSKRRLVELVQSARPAIEAVLAVRRAATAARLAGIAYLPGRNRRSAHAALSARLHPPTGEAFGSASPIEHVPPPEPPREIDATARDAGLAACWQALGRTA